MIQVVLATQDPSLVDRLRLAIGDGFLHLAPLPQPTDVAGFEALLNGAGRPDIAIIDTTGAVDETLALAAALARETTTQAILVSPEPAEIAYPAVRAGVRDVLPGTATAEELRASLERTAEIVERLRITGPGYVPAVGPGAPEGQVVTVTSPKGGVGKTTVATNLAVGLARQFPQQVVLVDIDVHFGDVGSALNLAYSHSLPEIAHGPSSHDSMAVKALLTRHSSGLYVVPGSESPADADAVTANDVGRLIQLLRRQFSYVIVDTAPGLTDHTLAALDHTDVLVLVTSLDVPGVRGLRKELDTLVQVGMMVPTRHIVVNFNDRSRGMTIADVEATINQKVGFVLPQSNSVPLSTNQGVPLVLSAGRDPVVRKLMELVAAIAPAPATSRAFGRRHTR